MIISIVLAAVVVVLILSIVGVICFFLRRRRDSGTQQTSVGLSPLTLLEDITIEEQLGQGNFGTVYKGTWKGTTVALKAMNNEEQIADFEREESLLQ